MSIATYIKEHMEDFVENAQHQLTPELLSDLQLITEKRTTVKANSEDFKIMSYEIDALHAEIQRRCSF